MTGLFEDDELQGAFGAAASDQGVHVPIVRFAAIEERPAESEQL